MRNIKTCFQILLSLLKSPQYALLSFLLVTFGYILMFFYGTGFGISTKYPPHLLLLGFFLFILEKQRVYIWIICNLIVTIILASVFYQRFGALVIVKYVISNLIVSVMFLCGAFICMAVCIAVIGFGPPS